MLIFDLIGSLGLFLLGMWLMTEGLKLAGGRALHTLLGRWTSTRLRGLGAGVLVTALVQSSSAVTVATIGFVNAGLMSFQQSVWVIFGSNVGTTLTAWLVTLFGFSVNIETFTFPLFGIGAFLRVFSPFKRGQAMGMALAGFGLLFMGIDALQGTFEGVAANLDVGTLTGIGVGGVFLGLLIGFVLTLITQSSSAAVALILTAVASGLADLNVATAAVVGANIGTTSTALIATIAATANARRLALAHVTFNLLTGLVALLLIPLFLFAASSLAGPEGTANPTLYLAVFHTSFNVLGVILMIPIEPVLSRRLLKTFEQQEPTLLGRSKLDRNVAAIPDLAMRALSMELADLQSRCGGVALDGMVQKQHLAVLDKDADEIQALDSLKERLDSVDNFISLISQSDLTPELSGRLTAGFSASHYLQNCCETMRRIEQTSDDVARMKEQVYEQLRGWLQEVTAFTAAVAATDQSYDVAHWGEMLQMYQRFKQQVLSSAVEYRIDMASVETALLIGSLSRRFVEQLIQAKQSLELLEGEPDKRPAPVHEPIPAIDFAAADAAHPEADSTALEKPQESTDST